MNIIHIIQRLLHITILECEEKGNGLSRKYLEILIEEIADHIESFAIKNFISNCDLPLKDVCGSLVPGITINSQQYIQSL